jgi:hypothetical protein
MITLHIVVIQVIAVTEVGVNIDQNSRLILVHSSIGELESVRDPKPTKNRGAPRRLEVDYSSRLAELRRVDLQ